MCTVHQRKAELRFLKRGIGSQRHSNCQLTYWLPLRILMMAKEEISEQAIYLLKD